MNGQAVSGRTPLGISRRRWRLPTGVVVWSTFSMPSVAEDAGQAVAAADPDQQPAGMASPGELGRAPAPAPARPSAAGEARRRPPPRSATPSFPAVDVFTASAGAHQGLGPGPQTNQFARPRSSAVSAPRRRPSPAFGCGSDPPPRQRVHGGVPRRRRPAREALKASSEGQSSRRTLLPHPRGRPPRPPCVHWSESQPAQGLRVVGRRRSSSVLEQPAVRGPGHQQFGGLSSVPHALVRG